MPAALANRLLYMCDKRSSYEETVKSLAEAVLQRNDTHTASFQASAVHKAHDILHTLRTNVGSAPTAALQWQLFQQQLAVRDLERALGVDPTANAGDAGARLMEAVQAAQAHVDGPLATEHAANAAATLTPATLASQTSSCGALLRAQLKDLRAQVAKLTATLQRQNVACLPLDSPMEDVRDSAFCWLIVWLQELGNAVRKRHGKIRFEHHVDIKLSSLSSSQQDQLKTNVRLFNDMVRHLPNVGPANPLTETQVLNSDTWLEERNLAGPTAAPLANVAGSFAFMNAVCGIMRADEEIIATQNEMIGFVRNVAAHFWATAESIRCTLRDLHNGVVCLLIYLFIYLFGFSARLFIVLFGIGPAASAAANPRRQGACELPKNAVR